MALLARHGERLPRPTRVPREGAAVEARLNATDRALAPHAGGVIVAWSPPVPWEVRDDQGICATNPDTGQFMHYRLAGAYDSNVALLVTAGDGRKQAYLRLSEILRRTRLRGHDLRTNREFHYGLVHWFLARDVHARPTTRFVRALPRAGRAASPRRRSASTSRRLWAGVAKRTAKRARSRHRRRPPC